METYDSTVFIICYVGFFLSIITGIIHALCKKTLRYVWLFGCIAGFCFSTVIAHISFSLAYDDPSAPNYEGYKNWNIYRFILSDIIRLIIWSGIGVLNYLAFIKQNKRLKKLFTVVMGLLLIMIMLLFLFSFMTSINRG